MNSVQRKYIIDKITEKVKNKIKVLESEKVETPTISSYMLHEILSERFEIKNNEELRCLIIQKAQKGLSSSRPENFLGDTNTWSSNNKNKIALDFEDFFVLPQSYKDALNNTKEHNNKIREQINLLNIQAESLETRIMLASDKTLQKMINEVDDMGDISLIDTKIKLLD